MPSPRQSQSPLLGIDLGGSQIKAVAVNPDGHVLRREVRETLDGHRDVHDWARNITSIINTFESSLNTPATAVGLAAPGIPSADHRTIAFMPGRLQGLVGFDWTNALRQSRPVPVLNDATAALLGEAWIGAATPYPNAILLTLGTGVGGAILRDGQLMLGTRQRAGHLGHISLNPFGDRDIVNTPGSLEDWIGDQTVAQRTQGRYTSTRILVEAVGQGDPQAQTAWQRSIKALAAGIASLINVLDPDAVIIGGGIALAGPTLFEPLSAELELMEWRLTEHPVPVIPAALGPWAGAIGAARNAALSL